VKKFFLSILAFVASTVMAQAITVVTPINGAEVTSPFALTAGTDMCGSVPAVSMGYSIDHNRAIIEPTSFSTMVIASPGPHVLHVKCWGKQVHDEVLLNIRVGAAGPASDIKVASPVNGAQVTSPFNLTASATNCRSYPAVSMSYSMDGGRAVTQPASFSAAVTANPGTHSLQVRCSGQNGTDQVLLSIRVVPPPAAATPLFSLASGKYAKAQTVTLSDATPGATIHYTTDGSAPSANSPQYTSPLSITASTLIQALAVAPAYSNSRVATAAYTIIPPSGPSIPANATKQANVHLQTDWRIKHDPATPGSASGAMSVVDDPSLSGQADRFVTSFTDSGGELYSLTYGNDPDAHNFVYDAEVWIEAGSSLANLEMDNNQVMPNGDTVIYAFQCSGYAGVWEYTENAGTPKKPIVKWLRSTAPCNPANWTPNAWHHVQISYSRDDAGNVTYHSVWLDGAEQLIEQTVNSAFTLGWAHGALVTNFQVDGLGANGWATLNLDSLTIYRW
jgi:hypothetical protein